MSSTNVTKNNACRGFPAGCVQFTPRGVEQPTNPSLKPAKSQTSAAKSAANRAAKVPETHSIDDLAASLLALPKVERLRLAKLLLGQGKGKGAG